MAQIQIVLDSESVAKLDACAKVCGLTRAQMLKAAIDEAARQCKIGDQRARELENSEAGHTKKGPYAGMFSINA